MTPPATRLAPSASGEARRSTATATATVVKPTRALVFDQAKLTAAIGNDAQLRRTLAALGGVLALVGMALGYRFNELFPVYVALFSCTGAALIAGLCAIRDHARALLDLQLADADDSRIASRTC